MSKLYAIHAFENIYCGLHGIENFLVVECLNDKEAEECAIEMSYEVMDSYNRVDEELLDYIGIDYDDIDNHIEEYEEVRAENTAYEVWEVKDTMKSLDELNELFYNDTEDFIEKYCIKII